MAARSVGRRAARSRIIEPGRIPAREGIVNGSGPDRVSANDRPAGEILGPVAAIRDVTTRFQREKEMARRIKELETGASR
jgi:hypothetical protein